jgi:uncharacterized protein (TIGR00156 family)
MKRLFFVPLALFVIFSFAACSRSDSRPSGVGYFGPGEELVTAEQALSLRKDGKYNLGVTLKGRITHYYRAANRDAENIYLFADSSGVIKVVIPTYAWMGQRISESDTVEISGEIFNTNYWDAAVYVGRVIKR